MLCYNIGCGKKFEDHENTEKSCIYHIKPPVFHDGKKGWDCCKRFTTDFSTCLSTPGCQLGYHNPDKPKEEEKPTVDSKYDIPVVVVNPIQKKPERPNGDEEMENIEVNALPSLKSEVIKRREEMTKNSSSSEPIDENSVPVGTTCKNPSCSKKFTSSEINKEICMYHSGQAIFHEGLKFWTCCARKTTDFDSFMAQEGCTSGKHAWVKTSNSSANCRYDWFQTGANVTISLYGKLPVIESCVVKGNCVRLSVSFEYDCGQSRFERAFELAEEIDVKASQVKLSPTKVEIVLRKLRISNWTSLEIVPVTKAD